MFCCTILAISIHALREEGDPIKITSLVDAQKFLSTPSARRATLQGARHKLLGCISIHALREEGDAAKVWTIAHNLDFYPRPPRGGRR